MAVIDDVRALCRELLAEGQSQEEVGAAFGRSQGWVSQVLDGQIKEVKAEVLATVNQRLPGRLRRVQVLLREDRVAALEEYFEERERSGRPVRAKVVDRARASARSTGMATRTEAAALVDFLEGVIDREERAAPEVAADPRNVIDTASGQQEAPEGHFKRRGGRTR